MLLLLTTLIAPTAINAQCFTLGGSCAVCKTVKNPTAAELANCHISSPMGNLIQNFNGPYYDAVTKAKQWFDYSRTFAGRGEALCPVSDDAINDLNDMWNSASTQAVASYYFSQGTLACRFNADKYGKMYPDLARAFGTDANALKSHYINSGINAGRSPCGIPSCTFDAGQYLNNNPDVRTARVDAKAHYQGFGINENRLVRNCPAPVIDESIIRGPRTRVDIAGARTRYRTLGCFLAISRRLDNPTSRSYRVGYYALNSYKLDVRFIRGINSLKRLTQFSSTSSDSWIIDGVDRIIRTQTGGANIFSSYLHEFSHYYVAWVYAFNHGVATNVMAERLTYIYWTFLKPSVLGGTRKAKYDAYQRGTISVLPRKRGLLGRQTTSNAVFSYETLRATCPNVNPYLTTGCLTAIGYQCETTSAQCRDAYNVLPVNNKALATSVLTTACPSVRSAFPTLCSSNYAVW